MSTSSKPVVLAVDDNPDNLLLINDVLKDRYKVKGASNGARALQLAQESRPDLILLDIMMPQMDGYEVCRRLQADERTRDIPVIFVTAKAEEQDEEFGLSLGAVDYITKPINAAIVRARVHTQLEMKAAADFLRDKHLFLERQIEQRTGEIVATQDAAVVALASLAEIRDNETGNHIRRTQHYVRVLAEHLRQHSRYAAQLSEFDVMMLFKSAPLHDIGKVGIPDHILLKPGRLTPEEFSIMQTHTTLGRAAIERAEQQLGVTVDFLHFAKDIAYSHQEKWDGSGYPQGLAGEAIPLSARIMALADVYDALISRRPYKEPMSHQTAYDIICAGRGSYFDPEVVDAFVATQERFREIAARFSDAMHAA